MGGLLFGTFVFFGYKQCDDLRSHFIRCYCSMPEFTPDEVKKHKTKETRIWVTYQNKVYDITNFVNQHPGGDKIMLAAGGPVEPFWSLYAVHQNNKEVLKILEQFEIGTVRSDFQEQVNVSDPYSSDPSRHPALKVVCEKPFNAETPTELLPDHFNTPNDLFFVRNHLPVPKVDIKNYKLIIESNSMKNPISLRLPDLKKMKPVTTIESTIMCAGNRRNDMSKYKPVKGLPWEQGAISTAKWTGIKLVDLFSAYDLDYEKLLKSGAKYIQFEGLDVDPTGARYGSSIPIEIALDPRSDVLLAYFMNNEDLSRDHGYPLRVIMPGVIGARQVKWLSKIIVSEKESDSFWQQQDYKTFSPDVDFHNADYKSVPPVTEPNVQSAICVPRDGQSIRNEGTLNVKGYAWSGGGRGIIRVEVSTDNGNTWKQANITQSKDLPVSSHINRKQWAWVLWEIDVPVDENCNELEILCKAVDSSQNSQPESFKGSWNVRGLMANAWHRIKVSFYEDDD